MATLQNVNLSNSQCVQAQFSQASFQGCVLSQSDLTYADLSMTVCRFTDFANTELFRTNLHGLLEDDCNWSGAKKSIALGTDEKLDAAQRWKPKSSPLPKELAEESTQG